ncbi:MAG: hypothetical protein HN995_09280 [Candidatus Marinimicrobia bacterium]|jgi:hypothetical protein|nr:hypothetical protein [Candidatus Neomarinimicrobiota bacterium]MBT3576319.1 hypothetical protein [Candidatus Neomarinimicrobiota bacterium]MBT3681068.1 hypothetical protein [Candidatus Neomarinimicrobiota bacterium]MBT4129620.1 hypothetical protein [Candidatus Neomarinimicrobiota bacterium]MBT4294523.1 hypothetical protein [Candidatus Neomarinimicrobiota bacterium]
MKTLKYLLALVLTSATVSAKPANLDYVDGSENEDMSIEFVDLDEEPIQGRLISSDDTYYYFHNHGDASMQIVSRSNVQYLETNMNLDLHSLLKGKDPDALGDVIELNDGTRIPSIILDVSADQIQYFTGISMKRETLPASSIYMLYLDDATISIPFPLASSDMPIL